MCDFALLWSVFVTNITITVGRIRVAAVGSYPLQTGPGQCDEDVFPKVSLSRKRQCGRARVETSTHSFVRTVHRLQEHLTHTTHGLFNDVRINGIGQ